MDCHDIINFFHSGRWKEKPIGVSVQNLPKKTAIAFDPKKINKTNKIS